MKKSELFFGALLVPVDYLMIVLASIIAWGLRFSTGVTEIKPVMFDIPFSKYFQWVLIITPIFLLIFALAGLYSMKTTRNFLRELGLIVLSMSAGVGLIIITIFLNPDWFSSRFVIISGWLIGIFLVSIARYLVNFIQKLMLVYWGIGVHRLMLIGKNKFKDILYEEFKLHPELGYEVISQEEKIDLESLRFLRKTKGIDEIFVADPEVTMLELRNVSDFCHRNRIDLKFVPAILQSVSTNFELSRVLDEPVIVIKNTPLEGWGKIAKRIFDIVGSLFGLILAAPIMLLTAIVIKLDSRGPVIFKNERVGHKGNFNLYKFRYMKLEYCVGEQNPNMQKALDFEKQLIKTHSVRRGPLYKIKNDPRKTRVGRIIEPLSIDELPQLWNVLKGDMSLVGPRPHQPREVEKYEEWQKRTLSIKPGVTGLAQISGRSDLNFSDEARLDIYYIENWSIWLDIQIIFKTFFILFKKRENN